MSQASCRHRHTCTEGQPVTSQSFRESQSGGESAGSRWKRKEEGVSLRVDLDAAAFRACLPNYRAVIGERTRIGFCAKLAQQRGRPVDVGEDKGDGAGR